MIVTSYKHLQIIVDNILANKLTFAFDCETTSLDIKEAKVVCFQLGWKQDGNYYGCMIPVGFEEIVEVQFRLVPKGENPLTEIRKRRDNQLEVVPTLEILSQLLSNPALICCGSNLKYDFLVALKYKPDLVLRCQVRDTTLSAALMHKPSLGLKENTLLSLGIQMATFEESFGDDATRLPTCLPDHVAKYAIPDVTCALQLVDCHTSEMTKLLDDPVHNKKLKIWTEIECPNVIYLAYMEHFGIELDCDHIRSMEKELKSILKDTEERVYAACGATLADFSITSSTQLVEYFIIKHKHWSPKDTEETKGTQQYVCDGPTLQRFAESRNSTEIGTECATLIGEYRKLDKLISTYMCLPDDVDALYRLHTEFTQVFTDSFRLSSRRPNLQNIPARGDRGREMRKAFRAARGYRLVVADYSNAELRITAHITGDEKMLMAFRDNRDLHEMTAEGIGLITIDLKDDIKNKVATNDQKYAYKDGRSVGKTFNFAAGYGAGVPKLTAQLNLGRKKKFTIKQVTKFKDDFWKTYSGFADWKERNFEYVSRTGFSRSPFGYTNDFRHEIKRGLFYKNAANNFPIQNTAGAMIKLAQANILKRIMEDGKFLVPLDTLDAELQVKVKHLAVNGKIHLVKPLLQVHDELVIEVIDVPELVEYTKNLVSTEMTKAANLRIPCPADATSGYNWYDAKV